MDLSDEADDLWSKIKGSYLSQGFPLHTTWWFRPEGSEGAVRELEAVRYIKPRGVGRSNFCLTDEGLDALLRDVEISDEAFDLIQDLGRRYEADKFPPIKSFGYKCQPGDKVVGELVARGYVEFWGVGAQTYRLTDYGQRWIMENRQL